jgi:hypothetical protein
MLVSFASAQYVTQQTKTVEISTTGVATVDLVSPETNTTIASVSIAGAAGSNITVTTAVYQANPIPDANVTSGVTLGHFVVISFDVHGNDFSQANVTVPYTDSDVQGVTPPYSIYKYIPESNTFVALPTVNDATAKTLTVTLNSSTDPLFAIGNAVPVVTPNPSPSGSVIPSSSPTGSATPAPNAGTPDWVWIALVVVVIAIVLVAALVVRKRKS